MKTMFGCSALIASVFFVIGSTATWIANDPTVPHPLLTGAMVGGMAFSAALLLIARDRREYRFAMRAVREPLLARADMENGDFVSHFPDADPTLAVQTREAVARFFDVPVQKVFPTDRLRDDLQFHVFQLYFYVIFQVLAARSIEPRPFSFDASGLANMGHLIEAIQQLLNEQSARRSENDPSV